MNKFISIMMGSKSDLDTMTNAGEILSSYNITYEYRITSAHRTPNETKDYIIDAEERGCQIFIVGAGLAAHLAGAVAAHTTKPVIGVPLNASSLGGIDSLLSTVQMPSGIPVATVAIGRHGAKNAAYLALQIMAINDPKIKSLLEKERQAIASKILESNF